MLDMPLASYGIVGDTRTVALISDAGSVDWLCFPRFDSEPLFGALVGGDRGGSFTVAPDDAVLAGRRYLDGTAVIETTHRSGAATVTTLDGMVLDVRRALLPQSLLVRQVSCSGGAARIRIRFDPRDGWSGAPLDGERRRGALLIRRGRLAISLTTSPDLAVRPGEELELEMRDGDGLTMALGLADAQPAVIVEPGAADASLRATIAWWRDWWGGLVPGPIEPDAVRRSLLTLRLLLYAPSGAPVAAPTTSLPEVPGGDANWDYRFAWIRDASLGTSAFIGCGRRDEADAFLAWMFHAGRLTRPGLRVAYDILGGTSTTKERTIPGVDGYAGSLPVRVGNAAADQFQLDAYGWMIQSGWDLVRSGVELDPETRRAVWGHADVLSDRWAEPDHGVWELRGEPRHYVHSKAMAWLGLDRAIELAERVRLRRGRRDRWIDARDRAARELLERGFDPGLGSFVQAYDAPALDAAALPLAWSGLLPGDAPQLAGTVEAVRRELGAGGPLLYRFAPEGEGAFLPCSFWLAQALGAIGRREEGRELLAETCRLATPLGLFAEEMDPSTLAHVGNTPQALTHAALVLAARSLADGAGEPLRAG
jgi:GH15 family glucan-1,4-alpha-glucosidase